MQIECTVKETAAGASRTVATHSGHTGIDYTLITRQSGISIRAEHDHMVTIHFDFGTLLAFNFSEIRIQTLLSNLLRQVKLRKAFVKNIHV